MSLQRGTYGIEFDEQQGSPFRRLWIPAALVLAVALPLLFFRSCGGRDGRDDVTDEEPGQTRYRVPEVEARRERPSLWRHFLKRGGGADAPAHAQAGGGTGGAYAPGGQEADGDARAAFKVQSPEVRRLLERVAEHEGADDPVNARLVLHQLLLRKDAEDVRAFIERKIGTINTALVFGDRPMPEKTRHPVVAGDLIGKLAKRYGNTEAYLLKANGIDRPDRLRIGREIWVLRNPVFELAVFPKTSSAVLTLDGQFFKRYETGLGAPSDVPAGTYTVRDGVLARLGLRSVDAEELRVLLPFGVKVEISE
jgi:LysM repeat protein